MHSFFSNLYPKKIKEGYIKLIKYSNMDLNVEKFIGSTIFYGIFFSIGFSLLLKYLFNLNITTTFLITFVVLQFLIYFVITLKVDNRARAIENILPDALQLMSSNLRAGFTTDRALLLSARPEFGPLKDELNKAAKEITIGKTIEEALLGITKRVRSEVLEKTFLLIVSGIKRGGELAILLEQVAKNLRQQRLINQKIKSGVLMYVIFIFVAIGLVSPILFGLSSYLVDVLSTQLGAIDIPETASTSLPFQLSGVSIDQGFIILYSVISLISISIFGSLLMGLINRGKINQGMKYIPGLIALTMALFFLSRYIIQATLGGLFGTT